MELIRKYKQGKLTTADVRTINNTIICLMVLIAATSIIWSICIHILSGDFYSGIIGAKLVFRERDFTQMDEHTKEVFYRDLGKLINETYNEAAIDEALRRQEISKEMHIMPEENANVEQSQTTKKPKVRKIPHVFQTSSNINVPDNRVIRNNDDNDDDEDDEADEANKTAVPKVKFDVKADREFLARMTIDIHQTRWRDNVAVQFIYSFPFLSEIIAIIWTAMCLIFQSSIKKYWGLPKPWRIVIPSILVFTLMTLGTLVYTILAQGYLKTFCQDLREQLTHPNALSCGQAMSVLRPLIRQHEFSHSVYLNLFRISYILTMVFWLMALLIMILRYMLAIDFQLVDVLPSLHEYKVPKIECTENKEPEFTEVLLNSPQQQTKLLKINERPKSEDDFQSAKSHLSEVATPLLEYTPTKVI